MALTKIDDRGLKTPIDLQDNEKIRLGTGNDLELYHNGTHTYMINQQGNLYISDNNGNVHIQGKTDEEGIIAKSDGAVELYYNNAKKLETTSTGVLINGQLDLEDDNAIRLGSSDDLQIYHDGTNNWFWSGGGHPTIHESSGSWTVRSVANENYIVATENGSVDLYYDNGKKFETKGYGVTVSGHVELASGSDLFKGPDNAKLNLGNGNDLQIYHDGTHSQIKDASAGELLLSGSTISLNSADSSEYMLKGVENGAIELYYNGSKKFETTSSGAYINGHLDLDDGKAVKLGSGDDLQVYHDGTDSYITNLTGSLYIIPKLNENGIQLVPDGTVRLYYDNSAKFETTSYGNHFNGNLRGDDGSYIQLGSGQDLELYHDGSHSYIRDNGTGNLVLKGSEVVIQSGNSTETKAVFKNDGACELYHNDVKKLETASWGVDITGQAYVGTGSFKADDNGEIHLGNSADLKLYHNGSNSYIVQNGTGELYIRDADNSTAVVIESTHGNTVYQKFSHTGHDNNFIGYEDDHFVVYTKNSGADSHSKRINVDQSGLAFNADTAAANRLNDYETGTWTPTVGQGTVSVHDCNYTKVGRLCTVQGRIDNFSNNSSSSTLTIHDLPFTAAVTNVAVGACFYHYCGREHATTLYINASSRLEFYGGSGGNWNYLRHQDLSVSGGSTGIYFTATYQTT